MTLTGWWNFMDKVAKLGLLIDFYGNLLTEKQLNVIDLYYNNDYSLGEISENLGISRQGVFDRLKRAENILFSLEEKLRLVDKFVQQKDSIRNVLDRLNKVKDNRVDNLVKVEIDEIITILKSLLQ